LTAYFAERKIAWLCRYCGRSRSEPDACAASPLSKTGRDKAARNRLGPRRVASGPVLALFGVALVSCSRESQPLPFLKRPWSPPSVPGAEQVSSGNEHLRIPALQELFCSWRLPGTAGRRARFFYDYSMRNGGVYLEHGEGVRKTAGTAAEIRCGPGVTEQEKGCGGGTEPSDRPTRQAFSVVTSPGKPQDQRALARRRTRCGSTKGGRCREPASPARLLEHGGGRSQPSERHTLCPDTFKQ